VKYTAAAVMLILSACASGTLPWAQGPQRSGAACTASCDAHFEQCPQVFAAFPERGAVECPAERKLCMKACETNKDVASAGVTSTVSKPSSAADAAPPLAAAAITTSAATAPPAPVAAASDRAIPSTPGPRAPAASKEARLRELKHLYDEGLVSDDVYKERQRAILSEP
jgi:hypothetical protein